jgi:deoxyribonuclease V
VEFDVPAIGVAKSLLYGTAQEPERRRGAWAPILDGRQVIGAAVRTRDGVRPVYVSIGHRVSLPTAVRWVLRLARSRIPEPTRRADRISRSLEANAVHL